jgi:hypothetical protein
MGEEGGILYEANGGIFFRLFCLTNPALGGVKIRKKILSFI